VLVAALRNDPPTNWVLLATLEIIVPAGGTAALVSVADAKIAPKKTTLADLE
jgi:hypothetical protein